MYIFRAVLFLSHRERLSTRKVIDIFLSGHMSAHSFADICAVQNNFIAYLPTQRGEVVDGTGAWACVTDMNVNFSDLESTAFQVV